MSDRPHGAGAGGRQVKTRLIPALGAEGACQLYRAMVDDLLEQAAATGLPIPLLDTGGPAAYRVYQVLADRLTRL